MTDQTKNDFSERLRAYFKMETQCADLYHKLVALYPEAKDLFETLAEWEERHADIISISIGYNKIGGIPEIIVPQELSIINMTIDMTQDIHTRIRTERISLHNVLNLTMKIYV